MQALIFRGDVLYQRRPSAASILTTAICKAGNRFKFISLAKSEVVPKPQSGGGCHQQLLSREQGSAGSSPQACWGRVTVPEQRETCQCFHAMRRRSFSIFVYLNALPSALGFSIHVEAKPTLT